jgi:hypothetical protein|tara:strand:- start:1853 stop:2176 length:324 start_codon:yes stop_codon:yes gene_type:complete
MLSKDMKKLLVHIGISLVLGVILVLMAYYIPTSPTDEIDLSKNGLSISSPQGEKFLLSPAKRAGFSIISLIFVLMVIKTVVIAFLIINKKTRHFIENSEHKFVRMFK